MTEQPPDALMSYTRFDDQQSNAYLTAFREQLSGEVQAHTGQPFHIFQDIEDIKWGQPFEQRIATALATITFFLPILTPSFFKSTFCRYELEQFLQREADLGRNDLVLPVYFIRVPALEKPALRAHDPLAQTIAARQRMDWRDLRFERFDSPQVRRMLARMAEQIADALEQVPPPAAPPEAPPPLTPSVTPSTSVSAVHKPAAHHASRVTRHVSLPAMIEIPAGPFLMGGSDDDTMARDNEKPQHRLELPPYWIGKTPVTNAQFRPFVEGDGYTNGDYWTEAGWRWCEESKLMTPRFWDDTMWNSGNYPVVGVSWFEAMAYCRWLAAQTGILFRLPTEAEWEKAARGPDGRIWPWGNTWEDGRCNSKEAGKQRTTPVGSYPTGASPYGVLDMAGNVWEWCVTKWGKTYPYQVEDAWTDAYLAGDTRRSIRGGSWYNEQEFVRGAYRYGRDNPRSRFDNSGLRLARSSLPQGSDA